MTNRLQYETSPYLLQHQNNPVDWYPWRESALQKAREEDKPILLSIGYSSCHWCHVMAHESFEDPATAEMMNELYVNVKVDREERPDVDAIYMDAVQALTGSGGWPMTVFLLPDGRPFYGGTYFPPAARYGMPAFKDILAGVHDAYKNRRDEVEKAAENLTRSLDRSVMAIGGEASDLNVELLDTALQQMLRNVDQVHGGFGGAPKFPQPMNLEFLLRSYIRTENVEVLKALKLTLTKMARGGIYDQIGGGFARYSVDGYWLVPHFEKMLYDNAQLSRLYLHTWQTTGDPFFRDVAADIYDYVLREMTNAEGGFYSATDADSEGEEGKFFVWSMEELKELLTEEQYRVAVEYWGVTRGGNFEGKNILYVPNDDAVVAERLNMTVEGLRESLNAIRDVLYAARAQRVHPELDDKVLASWNGLMLASLAEAARVLSRDDYLAAAIRAGDFLLSALRTDKGSLLRTTKDGESKIDAFLEDYANMIDALLELYQSTFDARWFKEAQAFAEYGLTHFAAEGGGFFDTGNEHEALIVRPRNAQDNALPSGNSMIAKQLLRLAAYTGEVRYEEAAVGTLRLLTEALKQYPQAFGEALNAVDMLVMGLSEIAIIGNPDAEATRDLVSVLTEVWRPNIVIALSPEPVSEAHAVPLLHHRTMRQDQPTAYVCQNFACQMPVTTPDELRGQIRR